MKCHRTKTHTFAGRSKPPADQSQPKSVSGQPGKDIFKNALRATKKEKDKLL